MKFVVLRRRAEQGSADVWEHVGAADVEASEDDSTMPELYAVEKTATQGGQHIAIPMEHWLLFDVEAKLEVRPVIRQAEVEAAAEPEQELVQGDEETDEEFEARGGIVVRGAYENLDGMSRPRQRR